jgi:hypothetical protein
MLYPLGVTIDFWEETAYLCPSWQIGASHKASLLVKFISGQSRKSNKSTILTSLPHGLELLEGNVHYHDAIPNGELVVSRPQGMPIIPIFPLDLKPPWGWSYIH